MRIGIIDFGTNTIRLDIFETEDKKYSIIFSNAIPSFVVENTVDGNLTQDGIEYAIQAIEEHQAACRHYRCDKIECFSTASLRYIGNSASVLEQVAFRSGIEIKMISGDEEANYDFQALKSISHCENGVGCDLGGGSIQVFTFDENGPTKSQSFALGSSRMAKEYVSGKIPTEEEALCIINRVKSELASAGFAPNGENLLAMGGTAKAIGHIFRITAKKTGAVTLAELCAMLKVLCEYPDESVELLAEFEPNRARTFTPGLAVLIALMEHMRCSKIEIYSVGVREGFLEALLKTPSEHPQSLLDYILGMI